MPKLFLYCIAVLCVCFSPFAFSVKAQQIGQVNTYPKITGYFSVMNPIGTWNKDGFHDNFRMCIHYLPPYLHY
jgi:hypothetical protein